ncbi:phosphoesterase [Acidovorax sp. SUPP3434]|uniref:DHH family phosphoesterase n=1 Tax=Acidovorax sp. SUPP3434 TaxID=2920880 RepID=UPI0023DE39B2|nr:DHHA1 domain-containing protein [Acidovorax sp. SUPP3434]GKS97809.1 phosphoesterase [Acidovorax sp. SUPP3434]
MTIPTKKTLLPLQLLVHPDKNDPNPLVLYHGRCADGFGAALAAWRYYGGQAECVGLSHGQVQSVDDLPALEGRAVYILDFSFAPDILGAIDERAAKLVMLDHHKSAAEKLTGFACRCGVVHFDMDKSGARLAWEFFYPDTPLPDLVRYVEDRDIWAWAYPESAGYLAALDMEPFDFARWEAIAAFTPEQSAAFVARGNAMDEKFRHLAADVAGGAQPITFNGKQGLMVNAPGAFHSLIGEMLSKQCGTFALMWIVSKEGKVKVGLRSQRNFDCSVLAESMGGGGHAQACGFRMGAERLPELLSGVFDAAAFPAPAAVAGTAA